MDFALSVNDIFGDDTALPKAKTEVESTAKTITPQTEAVPPVAATPPPAEAPAPATPAPAAAQVAPAPAAPAEVPVAPDPEAPPAPIPPAALAADPLPPAAAAKVNPEAPPVPTLPVVTAVATPPVVVTESTSDVGFTASGTGAVVIGFGDEVDPSPLSKYVAKEGQKNRISILMAEKIIATKTHWITGLGRVFCWGGSCCKVGGAPKVHYNMPILKYDTGEKLKIVSSDFEIQVLSVSGKLYKILKDIHDVVGSVDQVDLMIRCNEAKYQDFAFTNMSPAAWRTDKAKAAGYTATVMAEAERLFPTFLDQALRARSLSEEEYQEWASRGANSSQPLKGGESSLDNFLG